LVIGYWSLDISYRSSFIIHPPASGRQISGTISERAAKASLNLQNAPEMPCSLISFAQILCMRPIIILLALAGIGIITWLIVARPGKVEEGPKDQALAVSKHSEAFNNAISSLLADYNKLTELFVNWDSTAVIPAAQTLTKDLEQLSLDEIKKDSAQVYETAVAFLENAKGELQTIASEKGIRQQREAFNNLTDNIRQFLNTVKYDKEKLYLQECPMAFDDTKPGLWLSQKPEIRNPYLGLHHPHYGQGMLKCGETKMTINHTGKE
jgi:hypothetical protein